MTAFSFESNGEVFCDEGAETLKFLRDMYIINEVNPGEKFYECVTF
jgi:hypothetical protein